MKAIVLAAVIIVVVFCLQGVLTPCPRSGAYFPDDGCLPSPWSRLIRAEISRRLEMAEKICGKGNAEVQYAYWDDVSEFEDRFGHYCVDNSKLPTLPRS
jgi:hypothetical protein